MEAPRVIDTIGDRDEVKAWAKARASLGPRRSQRPAPPLPSPDDLDMASPAFARDPMTPLARLREHAPVCYLARHGWWLVTRHEDAREVLSDTSRFSSRHMPSERLGLIGLDPPEHKSARSALASHFAARRVEEVGRLACAVAGELLGELEGAAEFDLLGQFSAVIQERVVGRLLDLDAGQLERIRRLVGDTERDSAELVDRVAAAMAAVVEDATSLHRLLWVAGTTTTKRVIVSAMRALARDPALRASVQGDPAQLPALFEEVVRLSPPEGLISRLVLDDTTLAGVLVPAGAIVRASIISANRDPAVFDRAEHLVLGRPGLHLSFGAGPHRCPGSRMARTVFVAALTVLFERLPGWRLVQPDSALRWIPAATTFGVDRLIIAPRGSAATPTQAAS